MSDKTFYSRAEKSGLETMVSITLMYYVYYDSLYYTPEKAGNADRSLHFALIPLWL